MVAVVPGGLGGVFPHLMELDLTCSGRPGITVHVERLQAAAPNLRVLRLGGLGRRYGERGLRGEGKGEVGRGGIEGERGWMGGERAMMGGRTGGRTGKGFKMERRSSEWRVRRELGKGERGGVWTTGASAGEGRTTGIGRRGRQGDRKSPIPLLCLHGL